MSSCARTSTRVCARAYCTAWGPSRAGDRRDGVTRKADGSWAFKSAVLTLHSRIWGVQIAKRTLTLSVLSPPPRARPLHLVVRFSWPSTVGSRTECARSAHAVPLASHFTCYPADLLCGAVCFLWPAFVAGGRLGLSRGPVGKTRCGSADQSRVPLPPPPKCGTLPPRRPLGCRRSGPHALPLQ